MRTKLWLVAIAFLFMVGSGLAGEQELPPVPHGALDPTGVQWQVTPLAPGVFALVADRPPFNNNGIIIGRDGVLVVDSSVSPEWGAKLVAEVRKLTDKPIRYLINTNYHGDHTFGNVAFPPDTLIIAHEHTRPRIGSEWDRRLIAHATRNPDTASFPIRLPQVTFRDKLTLDLGDRQVELYHFGFANTPGDVVIYLPDAQIAFTGNLVAGPSFPLLLEGHAKEYRETIHRFKETLRVKTIVPGHTGLQPDAAALDRYLVYLANLEREVQQVVAEGKSLEETLAAIPVDSYLPPDLPEPIRAALTGFHGWNVKMTYQEVKSAGASTGSRD